LKSDLSASKRFVPFLSLLGLLVLLTVLTLFFSRQVLADATDTPRLPGGALVALVLVLPMTLAGAVGYQAWQLFHDRRLGKPGTALKLRISLFFLLTSLLASLPQAALSLNFIDTALKTWGNQRWGEALESGLQTALDYHYERIQNLRDTTESPYVFDVVRRALATKDNQALGRYLAEANLRADGVQVYDGAGTEILRAGRPEAFLKSGKALPDEDGTLPKQTGGGSTVLRQLRHVDLKAGTYSVVVSMILPPGFDEASAKLTEALDNYNQLKRSTDGYRTLFFLFYFLLALPILLIALLISFTQADDLVRPLINLESATRRIAAGDYSTRLLGPERSELAFLAESFNAMTAELATSRAKLLQTEKITAWQEIARRLAHELRNPLTPIRLSAERILRRSQTDPAHLVEIVEPAVGAILTEVVRLDALLKEFAGFARLPAPQKAVVDLRPLVEDLLATYQAAHPGLITSAEGLPPSVRVVADPAQLEQVFTNLFKNAMEAMGGQGRLTILANLVKKGSASYCRVQIHDTGPGIPPELRDRIFQPYVTSKAEGTGLGLAIVERILFDHQGRVWFESQPGFGTTFFLDLPTEERT
jgi:nitrogen fixation/metabolism regulation signal transduction histidine kinase